MFQFQKATSVGQTKIQVSLFIDQENILVFIQPLSKLLQANKSPENHSKGTKFFK